MKPSTTSFSAVDDLSDEDALLSSDDVRRVCGITQGSVLYNDDYVLSLENSAREHLGKQLGCRLQKGTVVDYFVAFAGSFTLSARQLTDRPVPSSSITELVVKYIDENNAEQTLASSSYTVDYTTYRPLLLIDDKPAVSKRNVNSVTVSYVFDPIPGTDVAIVNRMMSLLCKGFFANEAGELVEGGSGNFYFRQADRLVRQYRHLQAA